MTVPARSDERRSFFARHVELWKRSGLSMAAYCRREEIAYGSFVQWCRRLDEATDGPAKSVSFAEVVAHEAPLSQPVGVAIEVARDVRIVVPAMTAEELASLVVALRSAAR